MVLKYFSQEYMMCEYETLNQGVNFSFVFNLLFISNSSSHTRRFEGAFSSQILCFYVVVSYDV